MKRYKSVFQENREEEVKINNKLYSSNPSNKIINDFTNHLVNELKDNDTFAKAILNAVGKHLKVQFNVGNNNNSAYVQAVIKAFEKIKLSDLNYTSEDILNYLE